MQLYSRQQYNLTVGQQIATKLSAPAFALLMKATKYHHGSIYSISKQGDRVLAR